MLILHSLEPGSFSIVPRKLEDINTTWQECRSFFNCTASDDRDEKTCQHCIHYSREVHVRPKSVQILVCPNNN